MKFSHSLQFNAVPEWSNKYIAYSQLKKLVYTLQTDNLYGTNTAAGTTTTSTSSTNNDLENTPLLMQQNEPARIFVEALDKELKKIDSFYSLQENVIFQTFDDLIDDYNEYLRFLVLSNNTMNNTVRSTHSMNDEDDEDDEDEDDEDDGDENEFIDDDSQLERYHGESTIHHMRPRSASSPTRRGSTITTATANSDSHMEDNNNNNNNNNNNGDLLLQQQQSNSSNHSLKRKKSTGIVNMLFNSVHDAISQSKSNPQTREGSILNESQSQVYLEHTLSLKRRIISVFTHTNELKSFIELNYTGFSKICKKFDKSLETEIKKQYLNKIETKTHIFQKTTKSKIEKMIIEILSMYSNICMIPFEEAESELNSHLREHVVWERNTVWKDMMNLERKVQSIKVDNKKFKQKKKFKNFNKNQSYLKTSDLDGDEDIGKRLPMSNINNGNNNITNNNSKINNNNKESSSSSSSSSSNQAPSSIKYFSDIYKTPFKQLLKLFFTSRVFKLIVISAISSCFFFTKSWVPNSEQRNCLVVLVFSALLWGTETLPLFVTALMIPSLIVMLPILKNTSTGVPFTPFESSQYILSTMWNSVIMLLIGGFTLAAALSKYNIAKVISTHILSSAGTNPKIILLTNMFVALFASMWVSNVAAPVLCYSIIQPLLRTLPKNCTYAKSLILGIALSSDIGGMASPIASPQNIMSIGIMDPQPSWTTWFIVTTPVSILCILGIWVILLVSFPIESNVKILKIHPVSDPFTLKQWYIVGVTCLTIVLWCLANNLKNFIGEMGMISVIPIVMLFGTGLLSSDDFNSFLWTIVVLAMGGTTLGKAVINSGLLVTIATHIKTMVEDKPIFAIVLLFGGIIIVVATFVSHTVAAMIIAPLMKEIGDNLPGDIKHSNLLVMLTAILCSGAMALPTSGFPNLCGISLVDDFGERYLTVGNFITRGVPATIWSYLVIVTVGYALLKFVGY